MKIQQLILIGVLFLTAACGAAAQEADDNRWRHSPESVIAEIYEIHAEDLQAQEGADRIVNSRNRRHLDKYFDRKLADLIWYDLTAERGEDDTYEVGVIDFDLFYATQEDDLTIDGLRIERVQIQNDRVTVRARFTSGGRAESVEYTLVSRDGTWKIFDIKYRDGLSLLKRFEEATR